MTVSWGAFAAQQPDLAARVRARFEASKHKTMATLRTDGAPRISGTESAFAGEGAATELTLGSMPAAVKLADLRRDPRIALHSATVDPVDGQEASWPGEAKVSGVAVETSVGDDGSVSFRLELDAVVLTALTPDGKQLCIESWHPDAGYRRRVRD